MRIAKFNFQVKLGGEREVTYIRPPVEFGVDDKFFCEDEDIQARSQSIYINSVVRNFHFFAFLAEGFQLQSWRSFKITGDGL